MADDIEFWSVAKVEQTIGLSRSEIYRRQKEGSFPASRNYRGSSRVFWISAEVRAWMAGQLADVDLGGLIG